MQQGPIQYSYIGPRSKTLTRHIDSAGLFLFTTPLHFVQSIFFCLTTPLTLNSEVVGKHIGLRDKEVVFLKMEWLGFEPRTSSIRRGHSTTLHLAWCTAEIEFSIFSKTFVCKNSKEESPIQNCYFEIEFLAILTKLSFLNTIDLRSNIFVRFDWFWLSFACVYKW